MEDLKIGDTLILLYGYKEEERRFTIIDINKVSYIYGRYGRQEKVNKKTLQRKEDGQIIQYYTEETLKRYKEITNIINKIRGSFIHLSSYQWEEKYSYEQLVKIKQALEGK